MQQKNSMHQVVCLEYDALRHYELLNAGAAYGLDFYITYIHGTKHDQYVTEIAYQENKFVYRYTNISPAGAHLTLEVYEKQKMLGACCCHIATRAGKFWCTRA